MCNAYKFSLSILAVAALFQVSCNSDDTQQRMSQAELAAADSLLAHGCYTQALERLDSIEAKYPQMIDVRRNAHAMRPRAIEQLTIRQIQSADSLIAVSQEGIAKLEGEFTHYSGGDLEGYFLPKGFNNDGFTKAVSFQPRINDADFRFYLVVNNSGATLNIRRIAYEISGQEYVSDPIPANSERTSRFEGSELAVFLPEEVDSIGAVSASSSSPISKVILIGDKGRMELKVSRQQAEALVNAWRYGHFKNQLRGALILREKLDRKLQTARDQIANTSEQGAM